MSDIPMVQVSPDFRRAHMGEWVRRGDEYWLIRECREYIAGRWESFISIEARFNFQAQVL